MASMDKSEIISAVAQAGVVGAGGAGFPAAAKLAASPEVILVNGAECEPLLQVDQRLALSEAESLAETLAALVEALGAERGIFAVKEKYHQAAAALGQAASGRKGLSVFLLGNYYPMGDEQVLVYEVLGRIVPEGGLPLARGVLVVNVESLYNIGRAMGGLGPVTRKYLTVTGEVHAPSTFLVPVGTPMSEVIAAAGGAKVERPVAINGGPMMGKLESDLSAPVTKTTKGLIVLSPAHPRAAAKSRTMAEMMRIARTACCHCMYCTELCPRYLLGHRLHPDKVMRLASYGHTGEPPAAAGEVFLCCECGLCEQACVMGLQPWRLNHELKGRLGPQAAKDFKKAAPTEPNRFRELRRYPIPRLVQKLGLGAYEALKAPLAPYPEPPKKVTLMLKQHLGAPAVPVVAAGAKVALGQLVAAPPEGALGAPIHASLDGTVSAVEAGAIVIESA
jgi:Na+-translocating ferredoxin:NAD+ oxidoreductase RnfC subunit